ncbi:MAG: response regulator transcription factor [Acidobacteria bacterium]|nr:response regulator transcription factor [Acidobacteriota bacterium]
MSAVLLVEDEQHLAEGLRFNLELEGYDVAIASDGESALALLQAEPLRFDVVALDVMLPGINGFEVATELRARGQFVPILMLTARNHPDDVLLGFEAGADDYLPKPFELRILLARLGGLLRRRAWLAQTSQQTNVMSESEKPPASYTFADKTVDFTALELRTPQRTIKLTVMEADLLRFLFKYEGKPVSRKTMLEEVWGLHEDTDTRAIDNFIVRLRKYFEDDPAKPKHLLTVRGVGYRFVRQPEE